MRAGIMRTGSSPVSPIGHAARPANSLTFTVSGVLRPRPARPYALGLPLRTRNPALGPSAVRSAPRTPRIN